ncbi:apolipoprotein N-acyltransferase [Arcanobacterium haemolyticum]|nr:apolipoprotein N-acyltransferase [Arcanobacterium haemolyticum]
MGIRRSFFGILLAIAAGLCLDGAFPPVGVWPLAILGVALLVAALEGRTFRGSFALGWIVGFAFFFPLVDWAEVAAGFFAARVALAGVEALYLAVLALIWQGLLRGGWTSSTTLGRILSFSLTWLAMEQLRSTWPLGGMPWGQLAFSQVNGPLVRLAPWGSTYLVGFGVVALGVCLELAGSRLVRRREGSGIVVIGGGAVALLVAMFLPLSSQADSYVNVGVVQGIVPKDGDVAESSRALTVTANLAEATTKLEGEADLVLWPESASDRDVRVDPEARSLVEAASNHVNVPILLGTQEYFNHYRSRHNDYVVWMPDGTLAGTYTKQRPAPFGEYMPYRDFFGRFTDAGDAIDIDMTPGDSPAYLDVPLSGRHEAVRIAVPICFEVAMNDIVAQGVGEGARMIVVPTNNASYGRTAESAQQFAMTRFRAIEHGRTAIQVSTVGVSGIVDPNGVVRRITAPWTESATIDRVSLRSDMTLATRIARPLGHGVLIAGAVVAALALIQSTYAWSTARRRRDH